MSAEGRSRRAVAVLEGASAFALLALTLVVLVDVLGRNVFNRPLPWGTEVLEVLLAGCIFLLHPVLAWQGGHITVDLLTVPRLAPLQRWLAGLIGGVLFGVIAWALLRQALRAADYGETTPLLRMSYAWIFASMALGAALAAVAFVAALWRRPAP